MAAASVSIVIDGNGPPSKHKSVPLGHAVRLTATFKVAGVLTSPTADVLTIERPSGVNDPVTPAAGTTGVRIAEYAPSSVGLATSAAADDIIDTASTHGYAAGDAVIFTALTGGTGLTVGATYYIIAANLAATAFQVSTTAGGAAVDFTADITAGRVAPVSAGYGGWYRVRWTGTGAAEARGETAFYAHTSGIV